MLSARIVCGPTVFSWSIFFRLLKPLAVLGLVFVLVVPAMAERFVDCHDGDTCTLENGLRVRLAGIDAPEMGQPFAEASRDTLTQMVVDKDSELVCTGWSYQRWVCNISVNGQDVQQRIVEQGFAYDYTQYSNSKYQQAEQSARQKQVGVWTLPNGGMRPWDYRHQTRRQLEFK